MAASLLTMFIKRSMISKRIENDDYAVLSPSEAMTVLNDALTEQSLPNCQFVTACYALIDHPSLTLRYARGGHPYPILITSDGLGSELKTPGGLLGIFKESEFPTYETRLSPGDKLLMYTDGLETVVTPGPPARHDAPFHEQVFGSLAHLPVDTMLQHLESRLDERSEKGDIRDDVTIIGLEVLSG
jgi:serine phosphatase RsbU (regulator of sigma subunit)